MTITPTALLSLPLITTGSSSGTWGEEVDNGLTSYLDIAIAGALSVSFTANAITLANTAGTSASTGIVGTTAQYYILKCSGLAAASTITAPTLSKSYLVINSDATYAVTIKATGQSGVSIAAGEKALVVFNGTDYVGLGVQAASAFTAGQLIKASSSTVLTSATAGTDYVAPGTATNFTATQTFSGTSSTLALVLNDAAEVATVSATAATGTINYDITTQSVLYYTSNASANWTVNFRGSSGTSLNTLMSTGQSMTVAFLVTQGATAYYNSAVQVDGTTSGVT
ncbi:MAG: hypothetical protein EBU33_08985, partial [Sphingobacteriia bacterium]|nr:hypothetical protein [Sphingobacteriia bacterium]